MSDHDRHGREYYSLVPQFVIKTFGDMLLSTFTIWAAWTALSLTGVEDTPTGHTILLLFGGFSIAMSLANITLRFLKYKKHHWVGYKERVPIYYLRNSRYSFW